MAFDFEKFRSAVETDIRQGKSAEARHALRTLPLKRLSREELLVCCQFARRAGSPALSVRWLNPFVHPSGRRTATATDGEKAEYAAALSAIGATEEALVLLKSVNAKVCPNALLFQAFAQVTLWDYAGGIPLLEKFLKTPKLDGYQRLVACANLAGALIEQRNFEEADRLLQDLHRETQAQSLWLLLGNILELQTRNALQQRDWGRTERLLAEIDRLGEKAGRQAQFFSSKWRCFLLLEKNGFDKNASRTLAQLREEAIQRANWETIRDCDRREARLKQDAQRYAHLYFGTRSPAYRKSLEVECQGKIEFPREYLWKLGGKEGPILDLEWTSFGARTGVLKAGQLVHRTLVALCSDFYRPIRLAALHYLLFPDQFYNPVSAPGRVHRALYRFREWAQGQRVPVRAAETHTQYRLENTGAIQIKLVRSAALASGAGNALARLKGLIRLHPLCRQ